MPARRGSGSPIAVAAFLGLCLTGSAGADAQGAPSVAVARAVQAYERGDRLSLDGAIQGISESRAPGSRFPVETWSDLDGLRPHTAFGLLIELASARGVDRAQSADLIGIGQRHLLTDGELMTADLRVLWHNAATAILWDVGGGVRGSRASEYVSEVEVTIQGQERQNFRGPLVQAMAAALRCCASVNGGKVPTLSVPGVTSDVVLGRFALASDISATKDEALVRLAEFLFARGRLTEAAAILGSAAEPASDSLLTYARQMLLAKIHESNRSIGEAATAYRSASQAMPLHQASRIGLASALMRLGDIEGALSAIDSVPSLREDDDPARVFSLGEARLIAVARDRFWMAGR